MKLVIYLLWKEIRIRRKSIRLLLVNFICPVVFLILAWIIKQGGLVQKWFLENSKMLETPTGNLRVYYYSENQRLNDKMKLSNEYFQKQFEEGVGNETSCSRDYLDSVKNLTDKVELIEANSAEEIEYIVNNQTLELSLMLFSIKNSKPIFNFEKVNISVGAIFRVGQGGHIVNNSYDNSEPIHIEYRMGQTILKASSQDNVRTFPPLFFAHQQVLLRLVLFHKKDVNLTSNKDRLQKMILKYNLQPDEDEKKEEFDKTMPIIILCWTPIIGFTFVFPLAVLSVRMLSEKSTRMKELLRLCGVGIHEYYLSYFILDFFMLTIVIIVFIPLFINPQVEDLLSYILILPLFGIASILYAMALATFFSTPAVGVATFATAYIGSYVIPNASMMKDSGGYNFFRFNGPIYLPLWVHLILCVIAPPGYAFEMFLTLMEEKRVVENLRGNSGYIPRMSNYFEETEYQSAILNPGTVLLALIGSILLSLFTIFYIGEIWPWQEGVPRSPLFPFQFLLPKETDKDQKKPEPINPFFFEKDPDELKCGVDIRNVRKRFGLKKEVLKGVSLKLYFSQITVLLGHNGAGKSTLMNILTGLIPPTSGSALINGYDIAVNPNAARRQLGLCPQVNVLFNDLNVADHLMIFGLLKLCPISNLKVEVDRILRLLSLEDKRYSKAKDLSGGMKRRLQLGCACVGGSRILILDEPSSGLDVEARREIWDLLLAVRKEYLIFITTHHMEEADCLGDRIAVMHGGELKCCGSTQFMKKMFGLGYFLRISKAPKFQLERCLKFIKKHLKTVKQQKETKTEIVLNFKTKESGKLPSFLDAVDEKQSPDIKSCGVSASTLDDVFIKIGQIFHTELEGDLTPAIPADKLRIRRTYCGQFYALFCKRFAALQRNTLTALVFSFVAFMVMLMVVFLDGRRTYRFEDSFRVSFMYNKEQKVKAVCELKNDTCAYFNVAKDSVNIEWAEDFASNAHINITENAGEDSGTMSCVDIAVKNATDVISLLFGYNALMYEADDNGDPKIGLVTASLESGPRFALTESFPHILLSFAILIAFLFNFLLPYQDIVNERISGAKLLQFMTGLHPLCYWISSFIFDFVWILIITSPLTVSQPLLYLLFDFRLFFARYSSVVVFLMAFLIVTAYLIVLTYMTTYFFTSAASGIFAIVVATLTQGYFGVLLLEKMSPLDEPQANVAQILLQVILWFCMLSPQTQMAFLTTTLHLNSFNLTFCDDWKYIYQYRCTDLVPDGRIIPKNSYFYKFCCEDYNMDILSYLWKASGFAFILCISIILFLVFGLLVLIMDPLLLSFKMYRRAPDVGSLQLPQLTNEDGDVANERKKTEKVIKEDKQEMKALTVFNLTKIFGKKVTVNRLTFGVDRNQCFGFLGVNGAGKSTTFKMLVGDLARTSGEAFVSRYSLAHDPTIYRRLIGYCPQFDCLVRNLTGREMLYLFGRLRGIHPSQLDKAVEDMISFVDLEAHASNVADNYSGGNKRKLSIGIALIGWPKLLLLDEPTAAVDPVARRKLWEVLETVLKIKECSIVLTSHAMDECEALCEKLVVMVAGQFKCLGSTQHLKEKFGKGFSISVKLKSEANNGDEVIKAIQKAFPGAKLKDSHITVMQFQVEDRSMGRGNIYRALETIKVQHDLEDYEVAEPNLEQIFLSFAKEAYHRK